MTVGIHLDAAGGGGGNARDSGGKLDSVWCQRIAFE